ncbi:MAG: DUF4157 domain-containing protein [Bacteroidota bacterium]
MKATESKTTSSSQQHHNNATTNSPFFQKEGEGSTFFSEAETDTLQRSPLQNDQPFFQPQPKKRSPQLKTQNSYPKPIQTKLKVGKPNDKYEKEADATADRVVQKLSQSNTTNTPFIQKNENEEQEQISKKEKGIQQKPIFESAAEPQIQAKPISNTLNTIQTQTENEENTQEEPEQSELDLQTAPIFQSGAPPDEDSNIQRQAEGEAAPTSDLESRLSSSRGGGSPLPDDTRSNMESSIGADFSNVRVHTGSDAVQMSNELGAQAFTHGSNIYFNERKYNPSSSSGQHLLAHELTHTLQQGASKPDLQTYGFGEALDDVTNFASDVAGDVAGATTDFASDVADVVGISVEDLRKYLAKFADKNVPGYSMLSVAIGYDVLRGIDVARNQDSVLKGVFSLINPLGSRLLQLLKERGIIEEAFTWINTQLDNLGLTKDAMIEKLNYFLDNVKLATTSPIDDNIGTFKRTFGSVFRSILSFVSRTKDQVFSMVKQAFLEVLAKLAKELGGYDLLADLLGFDPITEEKRNASTADILRGILQLPIIQAIGGDKLLKKLEEHNLIDKTANWINQQWGLLKGGFSDLLNIADKFLNGFSFETLKAPMKFVSGIKTDVVGFVTKIGKFFKNLASKALQLIKEVSIFLLKKFVNDKTYGFDLVKVILGKDPFTGEKFPRNAENIIGAFLKLLPQGEEVFNKLKETGAIQRTQAWIMNAIQEFVQILGAMKEAFVQLWSTSSIEDLFEPVAFFKKIMNLFNEPVKRMVAFVQRVLTKIFEVLLEIMKFPVKIVQKIIANITKAFHDIRKDPIGFLLRLLGAVKAGFTKFFDNIGKHLLAGVTGWLFGQVAKAGITPPKDLSLGSVFDLVMQILGLTVDKLWNLLAKKIGQKKVDKIKSGLDKLKGVWLFVKDVMQNGISAVWKYIKEKISNLWNIVLEEVKSWIITKIIEKVVTKLLSMLDPTGIMAVVNGFMAFFKAIQSAIEYFKQMLEVVESFTGGIAEIATGAISTAAKFLENALVKALPVAIGFLANQVGLGNIGKKLKEIIGKIQGFIEKALSWLVDKAVKGMKGIMGLFSGKKEKDEVADEAGKNGKFTQKDRDAGLAAFKKEEKTYLQNGKIKKVDAEKVAVNVKQKHPVFEKISVIDGGEDWDYEYVQRTTLKTDGSDKAEEESDDIKIGIQIGSGGNKIVYEIVDNPNQVIAILKEGKSPQLIDDEIELLRTLSTAGLSAVEAQKVTHNGRPAMIMDRYAQGSKDVVRLERGKVRPVGTSELLNQRSIENLQSIESTLQSRKIKIDDLQFLIGEDGSVVIADPLKVEAGKAPSKNNLRMIRLLIAEARKNANK